MGKFLRLLYGPISGLIIDGPKGLIQGFENAAAAIAGPLAYGAYVVSGLLRPGPPKPQQTETAIKNPIPVRVSGYGTNRLHMTYALYTTSAATGSAFDVGAFHDGRVDSIVQMYLGDKKITLGGGGFVNQDPDGSWAPGNTVAVGTTLGANPNTAFSSVATDLPDQWTTNHRGDGVVTGFVRWGPVKAKDFQKAYPTGGPNNMSLSLAMRLQPVFDWRDPGQSVTDPSTWLWSENVILHLAHYLLVRDNKDWGLHFAPTLAYWTAAADDCDLAVPLKGVQTILTAAFNHGDTAMELASVAGLSVGMTVLISATGDTSLSETRTVSSISGLTVTVSAAFNDHPLGSQVSWASDEGSPATEPRYRSCVAHQHTDPHKGVITNLLSCCDGWMSPRADGALVVYSGRYYAPTVTIGPDQIIDYSLQDGVSESDAVNQIAVTYISANHDYNQVDTDAWEDTDDISTRGKVLATTLSNQIPSHSQGRRLAKRKLAEIMAGKRGTTTTNASGKTAIGQRYIRQIMIEAGETFFDATVQITKLTRNLMTGGVTYEWILADSNVDSWNPATEEGEPAPVGNRVALGPLAAPVITGATPNFGADSSTGSPGVFIDLTVEGPDRADLTWFARTRQTGATTWGERQYTDVDPGATVEIATEFVPIDSSVEVEVAYQTGDGRISDWSTLETVDTSSAAIPPARVTGLAATGGVGTATITWNNPSSINFAATRLYHGTTTTFGSATQVGSDIAGVAGGVESHPSTETAGVRYFWVTSVSTGGAASTPVGPVSATVT